MFCAKLLQILIIIKSWGVSNSRLEITEFKAVLTIVPKTRAMTVKANQGMYLFRDTWYQKINRNKSSLQKNRKFSPGCVLSMWYLFDKEYSPWECLT